MRKRKHIVGVALLAIVAGSLAQTDQPGTVAANRLLAAVLIAEAGAEGSTGMTAIAEVVHRRSVERKQSIEKVLTTPFAFSCLNGKTPAELIANTEAHSAWPRALLIADTALHHPEHLPGITRRANHFYNPKYACPRWAKHRAPVAVIGKHAFYRL